MCLGEQLGLYALALAAAYYMIRSSFTGGLTPYSRQGIGGGGRFLWYLDVVIWKGMIGSCVGCYVVSCLGGKWVSWLGLWLVWVGVQGVMCSKRLGNRVWGLAPGLAVVGVLLPVVVAVVPFTPMAAALQGRVEEMLARSRAQGFDLDDW